MKLKLIGAALLSSAVLAPAAIAGLTQPAPVIVDLDGAGGGFAQGDLITARTDKTDTVFIGCGVRDFDDGAGGAFTFAFCQAEDEEGDAAFCNTQNPGLIESIRGSSDSSFLTFSWVDNAGAPECTRIGFSTQSFYLGKNTKGN